MNVAPNGNGREEDVAEYSQPDAFSQPEAFSPA
jgi:hypothetical protein